MFRMLKKRNKKIIALVLAGCMCLGGMPVPSADAAVKTTTKYYNKTKNYTVTDKIGFKKVTVNKHAVKKVYGKKKVSISCKKSGKYTIETTNKKGTKRRYIVYIDRTKPTVSGVKAKAVYTKKVSVKVKDNCKLASVTLNGKRQKSSFAISKTGAYTLTAKDKAGNKRTVVFAVKITSKKPGTGNNPSVTPANTSNVQVPTSGPITTNIPNTGTPATNSPGTPKITNIPDTTFIPGTKVPATQTPVASENPVNTPITNPTNVPTESKTPEKTTDPVVTVNPTMEPTKTSEPGADSTDVPSQTSATIPTKEPVTTPIIEPSINPTVTPGADATKQPEKTPVVNPTKSPATTPDIVLTETPAVTATVNPTKVPEITPTAVPTKIPVATPTPVPTKTPVVTQRPTSTPVVTPVPTPEIITITLRYSGVEAYNYTIQSGEEFTLPSPAKEGYTFLNWRDMSSLFTYSGGRSYVFTKDCTLYPQWNTIDEISKLRNEGFTCNYNADESIVCLTAYSGTQKELTIKDYYYENGLKYRTYVCASVFNGYSQTGLFGSNTTIENVIFESNVVIYRSWFGTKEEGYWNRLFSGCTNLRKVTLPKTECVSMHSMFLDCTHFNQQITIPSTVKSIEYTFQGCSSLTNLPVTLENNSIEKATSAFEGCGNLCGNAGKIYISGDGSKELYSMFKNCSYISKNGINIYIKGGCAGLSDIFANAYVNQNVTQIYVDSGYYLDWIRALSDYDVTVSIKQI